MFYYLCWVGNETFAHWRQLPGSLWAGVCDYDQFWSLAGRVAQFAEAMPNFSFCYVTLRKNQLFCAPIIILLYRYIIIKLYNNTKFSVDCCQYVFASGAPPRTPRGGSPPAGKDCASRKKCHLVFFPPMTCLIYALLYFNHLYVRMMCACILIDVYITPNGSGLNKNQTRVTQGGLRGF